MGILIRYKLARNIVINLRLFNKFVKKQNYSDKKHLKNKYILITILK